MACVEVLSSVPLPFITTMIVAQTAREHFFCSDIVFFCFLQNYFFPLISRTVCGATVPYDNTPMNLTSLFMWLVHAVD